MAEKLSKVLGIRPMSVSERLHMRLMGSPEPDRDDGYAMYPNWQLRMEIEDAKALESELALLRRAVAQLGHAWHDARKKEPHLEMYSFDFYSIDPDVLDLIKEPEPK